MNSKTSSPATSHPAGSAAEALDSVHTVFSLGVWSDTAPISDEHLPKVRQIVDSVLTALGDILRSVESEANVAAFLQSIGENQPGCVRVVAHLSQGLSAVAAQSAVQLGVPLHLVRHVSADSRQLGETEQLLSAKAEHVLTIPFVEEDIAEQAKEADSIIREQSDFIFILHNGYHDQAFRRRLSTLTDAGHVVLLLDINRTDEPSVVLLKGSNEFPDWKCQCRKEMMRILIPANEAVPVADLLRLCPKVKKGGKRDFSWDRLVERFFLPLRPARRRTRVKAAAGGVAKECGRQAWLRYKEIFSAITGTYSTPYRNHLLLRYIFPILAQMALILALYYKTLGLESAIVSVVGHPDILRWVLPPLFYGIQICLLLGMYAVIHYSRRKREHDIFYRYRVLAEYARIYTYTWPTGEFRNSGVLSGKNMPFSTWLTHRISRSLGLPNITFDSGTIKDWLEWVRSELVGEQIRYHLLRRRKYGAIAGVFARYSFCCVSIGIGFSMINAAMKGLNSLGPVDASLAILTAVIGIGALSFPCLANFFDGFSKNAGYEEYKSASVEALNNFKEMGRRIDKLLARFDSRNRYLAQQISYDEMARASRFVAQCTIAELAGWERSMKTKGLKALPVRVAGNKNKWWAILRRMKKDAS